MSPLSFFAPYLGPLMTEAAVEMVERRSQSIHLKKTNLHGVGGT